MVEEGTGSVNAEMWLTTPKDGDSTDGTEEQQEFAFDRECCQYVMDRISKLDGVVSWGIEPFGNDRRIIVRVASGWGQFIIGARLRYFRGDWHQIIDSMIDELMAKLAAMD